MTVVAVVSYDGHAINDGTVYRAWMPEDAFDPAPGNSIGADVNFSYPVYIDTKKASKDTITLFVEILGNPTDAQFQTRYHELNGWFNPQGSGQKYLITTWTNAPVTRRIAVRPLRVTWEFHKATITLQAHRPLWEDNELTTDDWTITASGQQRIITNLGNVPVAPVFRIQVTTAALNGWRWQRPVIVRNTTTSRLRNYPLEITSGGWDTAALITNTSKATAVDAGGGITSADTVIPCDSTALMYSAGWIMIATEQIYYSGLSATSFTGCVRGVNGTTAASHANNVAIYQSEMAADGSDIALEIDGAEVDRWFGGVPGAAGGPNSTTTKVWVNFPDIPAKATDEASYVLATYGEDLARTYGYGTASASSQGPDGSASTVLMAPLSQTEHYWQARGDLPQWIAVDLGTAREVNCVRLLLPRSDGCPRDFVIQASSDNWASHVDVQTITDSPKPSGAPRWTAFTFDGVLYRYWRLYITRTYVGWPQLHRLQLFKIAGGAYLKYGNPSVRRANDLSRQPIFELDDSTNTSWKFEQFYDVDRPLRPMQWTPTSDGLSRWAEQRTYGVSQDGGTITTGPSYEAGADGTDSLFSGAAQTFTATLTGELSSVELNCTYVPGGNRTYVCDIYSIVGGVWTQLGEIGAATCKVSGWVVFSRTAAQAVITLTSGAVYGLHPHGVGYGYGFESLWNKDASAPGYAGGSRYYWSLATWNADATADYLFRVNVIGGRGQILGVATKNADTYSTANAWQSPPEQKCGIAGLIYSGYTKQSHTYRTWTAIALRADGTRQTLHDDTGDTATFTAYGPLAYTISSAATTILFRQSWWLSTTTPYYGEVDDVTLTLSTPPTVEFQSALTTASVKFSLGNTSTDPQQGFNFACLLPLNTALDIDCETHRITEVLTGVEHAIRVVGNSVSDYWLTLAPGDNVLELIDEAVVGLSIETRFRSRWI
jgi:hypothetical protein